MRKILSKTVFIYVAIIMCVYPLFMIHGYDGLGDAKFAFFRWSTSLLMYVAVFMIVVALMRRYIDLKAVYGRMCMTDRLIGIYLAVTFVSFLLSPYKEAAIWGYGGWHMGLFSQLFLVVIYILVSLFYEHRRGLSYCILVIASVIYLIGLLQRFGLDPFGLYRGLDEVQKQEFLSTLGQTTWYGSYAIMVFPLGLYLYMTAEKTAVRILCGLFIGLQACMMCTTYCDSLYIGVLLVFLVMLRMALKKGSYLLRYTESLIIIAASFFLTGVCSRAVPGFVGGMDDAGALSEILTGPAFSIVAFFAAAAVYALLFFLIRQKNMDPAERGASIWVALTICAGACLMIFAGIIAVRTNSSPEGTGIFVFNDSWGNNRGLLWKTALRTFAGGSVINKIFGTGPDTFYNAYCRFPELESAVRHLYGDVTISCAHNDWLNMLVTGGIAGTAAYLAVFIGAIHDGFVCVKTEETIYIPLAAVCAYIGFNTFCYQQCVSAPIVFIMLGIIASIFRKMAKNNRNY